MSVHAGEMKGINQAAQYVVCNAGYMEVRKWHLKNCDIWVYAGNQSICVLLQILHLLCSQVLNLVVSFKYELSC